MPLLVKCALIKGFLVSDYQQRQTEFVNDVSQWLQEGKLKYKEDVVEGLENAPLTSSKLRFEENRALRVRRLTSNSGTRSSC